MLTNGKSFTVFSVSFLFLFAGIILPIPGNTQNDQISEATIKKTDVFIFPPRIVKYPLFSNSIESFSLHMKSETPFDKVKIRISIHDDNQPAEFFTNNIQWKKYDKYYYLTNIYGKQSEVPIVENYFLLEVKYKFKPLKYTPANIELLVNDEIIKSIPVDFLSPFEILYIGNKIIEQVKNSPKQKIAAIFAAFLFFLFIIDLIFRRKKRKNIPVCSTRARFSSLIEENQLIKIEETNNPFGCRLGGMRKKIKIEYKRSQIYISISGKKFIFPDNEPVDVDVNEFWKLHVEAQNYFGANNQSHKNIVILLLPV